MNATATTPSYAARLDADWRALTCRTATASLLKLLTAAHPGLPAGGADALVAAIRAGGDDQLVRALVAAAQRPGESGQIAARILLQALRPLAVRLARSQPAEPFADAHGQAVAALYQALRTVPLTRHGRIVTHIRMEAVWILFGARRGHHPAARRAIEAAAPAPDVTELAAYALEQAAASAEDQALTAVRAERAVSRASAAGLPLGEERGGRVELLELLLWAIDEHVITRRQAELLAEHGEQAQTENAARSRRRAIGQLRAAAARYLAATGA